MEGPARISSTYQTICTERYFGPFLSRYCLPNFLSILEKKHGKKETLPKQEKKGNPNLFEIKKFNTERKKSITILFSVPVLKKKQDEKKTGKNPRKQRKKIGQDISSKITSIGLDHFFLNGVMLQAIDIIVRYFPREPTDSCENPGEPMGLSRENPREPMGLSREPMGLARAPVGSPMATQGLRCARPIVPPGSPATSWHTVGFRGNFLKNSRGVSWELPWCAPRDTIGLRDTEETITRFTFPRISVSTTLCYSGNSRGNTWEIPAGPRGTSRGNCRHGVSRVMFYFPLGYRCVPRDTLEFSGSSQDPTGEKKSRGTP